MCNKRKLFNDYKFIKADIVYLKDLLTDADEKARPELEKQLKDKERTLGRINNALTVLSEDEEYVIRTSVMQKISPAIVAQKLNLSISAIYHLQNAAFKKMDRYLG